MVRRSFKVGVVGVGRNANSASVNQYKQSHISINEIDRRINIVVRNGLNVWEIFPINTHHPKSPKLRLIILIDS